MVKETKKLVYKKGLAVMLLESEEVVGEYESLTSKSTLRLYFKSRNSINNADKILRGQCSFDKKRVLASFEKGINGFNVKLNPAVETLLYLKFQYKTHIGKSVHFNYKNEHQGLYISETIYPSKILDISERHKLSYQLGPTANSQGTFESYLLSIKDAINEGNIIYCPTIY